MSSVFCISCFLASSLLVCGCFCALSCFHLPETEHWGEHVTVCGYKRVCISWLLRLLLLLVSISLTYVHPMFPYTQKVLLCGHWPGILIFISAPFSDLVAMQLIPKLCCADFLESLLSWCPSYFGSTPSTYYFHSSWSLPQCPFLHGVDPVPCEISPGSSCLTFHLHPQKLRQQLSHWSLTTAMTSPASQPGYTSFSTWAACFSCLWPGSKEALLQAFGGGQAGWGQPQISTKRSGGCFHSCGPSQYFPR